MMARGLSQKYTLMNEYEKRKKEHINVDRFLLHVRPHYMNAELVIEFKNRIYHSSQ